MLTFNSLHTQHSEAGAASKTLLVRGNASKNETLEQEEEKGGWEGYGPDIGEPRGQLSQEHV